MATVSSHDQPLPLEAVKKSSFPPQSWTMTQTWTWTEAATRTVRLRSRASIESLGAAEELRGGGAEV